MKTFYTLTILMIAIQVSFSQVAEKDSKPTTESATATTTLIKVKGETEKAILAEISQRLKETLKLPAVVEEFNIKGRSLVNVHLDKTGKITSTEIVESLGKSVDKSIMKAFKKINMVNAAGADKNFNGTVVQVPVVIQ